jgi:hypothetical protein
MCLQPQRLRFYILFFHAKKLYSASHMWKQKDLTHTL